MKFLLAAVNAKYIHSNPAVYSLRAYVGESLRSYVELAEYTINQPLQEILADIYLRKPEVIGFSCYIWNWNRVRELIREIPKILPDTDIWLGGPEVSYDSPEILREFPQLSGIMVGEGEETFRELLEWYAAGAADCETFRPKSLNQREGGECGVGNSENGVRQRSLTQIPGLCLRTGFTAAREPVDLNQIPFLYEDLEPFENRILYFETSRGCPYRCSYCLSSIDKKVRFREIKIVQKELQFFLDHRVKQVKFVDRTFNCNHAHAMAVWQYLYEHDNGVTNFHFEVSADILQAEEIALLRQMRPGLVQLEIGVQSVNPETIRAVNRVMDVERLEQAVASVHRGGNVHQHLDLIAGLPYEDYESFANSFNRVYVMRPEQLQLGFLKVLKGSPMAESAEEFGICYLSGPPYEVLCTKWLSYKDVLRLKRIEEMLEIYHNSNQFTHTLPFLERVFETPFAMYEKLADFYEEKGFFAQNPARAYRYQVMFAFAEKYDENCADIYRELLVYDMYLRENLKSRPKFAKDPDPSAKEKIREFYRTEERERTYLLAYAAYDWKQLSKMTHVESFAYPVWDSEELMRTCPGFGTAVSKEETRSEAGFVLFDYHARSPLTGEAATVLLEIV